MAAVELKMLLVLRIVRVLSAIDNLALYVAYAVAIAAPHLNTRIGGVYISSHTAANIALRGNLEENLASTGIAEIAAIATVLVAIPNLKLRG